MNILVNIWKAKNLSLKVKITIIRGLILLRIQFRFSMVFVPETLLKDIDTIPSKYIWANIKRSTLIAPVQEGGLSMVDSFAVHRTTKCVLIKISFLVKIHHENVYIMNIMYSILNTSQGMLNISILYTREV